MPTDFEALAQQLKADGYNAGVVARKLISQHGMAEPEAVALVERLFGTRPNPRLGDTATGVFTGLGLIAIGVAGLVAQYNWGHGFAYLMLALLGLIGSGVTLVIKSLVNAGAQTPL